MGYLGVTQGHWKVTGNSNIRQSTYESPSIVTLSYLASFLRNSEILAEKCDFKPPQLLLAPSLGLTPFNFQEIFGNRKLESVGYHEALFA